MHLTKRIRFRATLLLSLVVSLALLSCRAQADVAFCGGQFISVPFTDVAGNPFFCQIAEAYFSGLTNGTTATTYTPSQNVPREQMAAFVTRTLDQSLKRGSQRAPLEQNWTIQTPNNLTSTTVFTGPLQVKSDGADVWVANNGSHFVSRVRASDGKLLDTWTGATDAYGVLCAMGKVFVTGASSTDGKLYQIDPRQTAGAVTTLSSGLDVGPRGIAFDGQRIWTANSGGSVSIITLNPIIVINVGNGFTFPNGLVYDGSNIWVTDYSDGKIKKLDSNGNILTSTVTGSGPSHPTFDGTNIWVPNNVANTVAVVRAVGALSGTVLATLTGNGLNGPRQAAFDGERILVTNDADSVSLWKASDLSLIGNFPTGAGTEPWGACSDGINFWITFRLVNKVVRF